MIQQPEKNEPSGDNFHAKKLEDAVDNLCGLIRNMSSEELAEVRLEFDPNEPRWVSFDHEDEYFFECLHDEIERRKEAGDYETFHTFSGGEVEARGLAYAYADEDEFDWEVRCGSYPRVNVGWPLEIDVTDSEIKEIAEGRIRGFEMTPCQAEGCNHLVRRDPPYCWFHEPANRPS